MSDAREQLGDAISGAFTQEQYDFLVSEVLAIRKKAWAEFICKNPACGKRQKQVAEIPDARAVTGALADLMNQSWGRPNEVQKGEQDITVNRHVYLVDDHEDDDHEDEKDNDNEEKRV